MAQLYQIQSLETEMQILKSYIEPRDGYLRVLDINWMRKDAKGMKYSPNIITY